MADRWIAIEPRSEGALIHLDRRMRWPAVLRLWLPLFAIGMLATFGCGGSPSHTASRQAAGEHVPASSAVVHGGSREREVPRRAVDDEAGAEAGLMPSGLHADPDPTIRLYALEAWALRPGLTLDPVTYALVDPDESVRARAQEVLEEVLLTRQ